MSELSQHDGQTQRLQAASDQAETALDDIGLVCDSVQEAVSAGQEMQVLLQQAAELQTKMIGHMVTALVASGKSVADTQRVRELLTSNEPGNQQMQLGAELFASSQKESVVARNALVALFTSHPNGVFPKVAAHDTQELVARLKEAYESASKSKGAAIAGQSQISPTRKT